MGKEFMKLGPISCSIQAEPPYKEVRNGKTDFTLAKEKPALNAKVARQSLDSGHVAYEASSLKFAVRVNDIALGGISGENVLGYLAESAGKDALVDF